jgi:uncharacterized protein YceK
MSSVSVRFVLAVLIIGLWASGCAQIREFTLKDATAAKTRASLGKDLAGERCWAFIEQRVGENNFNSEIVGIMDAVEAARIVRLQEPELRKQIVASCGEVYSDVMVEMAKRARN